MIHGTVFDQSEVPVRICLEAVPFARFPDASYKPILIANTAMTTQLTKENKARNSYGTPISRRLGSLRVRYGLVIGMVGWLMLLLVIYALRITGFLGGR